MISNVAPGGQVALSVGPAQRNYMLEEGPTYDVFISQKNGEDSDTLTDFTIDSKEFLNTQHARLNEEIKARFERRSHETKDQS